MEIRKINYSAHFQRAFKKLPPNFKQQVVDRENIFKKNCFDVRLHTHKLSGKLKDCWSFSITHKHRVLFVFEGDGEVGFVDAGDHSMYQ